MGKKQSETVPGTTEKWPLVWVPMDLVVREMREVDSNVVSSPNSSNLCPDK